MTTNLGDLLKAKLVQHEQKYTLGYTPRDPATVDVVLNAECVELLQKCVSARLNAQSAPLVEFIKAIRTQSKDAWTPLGLYDCKQIAEAMVTKYCQPGAFLSDDQRRQIASEYLRKEYQKPGTKDITSLAWELYDSYGSN